MPFVIAGACACAAAPAIAHPPEGAVTGQLSWSRDPLVIGLLALSCTLYGAGMWRLRHRTRGGRRILAARATFFLLGSLFCVAALLSPVDSLGEELFSMHMLQHELLMLVVAPLLVMGRPLGVFIWAFPLGGRRGLATGVRMPWVRAFWHGITAPSIAWSLHAIVLWAWHFPLLFQASLASNAVHTLQHLSFLLTALLFWSALILPRSPVHAGNAVLYLLTTAIHTGILGALLTFSPALWYPAYEATAPAWGLSALEDQQLGGLIMWVPAGFVFIFAGLAMSARLLASHPQAGATTPGARQ